MYRGGRDFRTGSSLGMLSGRLRGGFVASTLPRFRGNNSISTNTPPPSTSDSTDAGTVVTQSAAQDPSDSGSGDQSVSVTSTTVMATLRAIKDTTTRLEQRFRVIEQQQSKLADSMRELQSLMKNQERDNFTIKGSAYEVRI